MKTLDRVLGWLLLALGVLHTAVSVVVMSKGLNVNSVWLFSGGLAVIFGAFLNLIRTYRTDSLITRVCVLANMLLLILGVLLCWVVRDALLANPQVVAFPVLILFELLFSIRQWLR
jgi:hypothetical protein